METFSSARSVRPGNTRALRELESAWSAARIAVPLSLAGVMWMQVLHSLTGASEHGEPPFLVHWLRDSALAFPVVGVAVWAGLVIARRLARRRDLDARRCSAGVLATVTVASTTSLALALGSPVHEWLFDASEGGAGAGHESSLAVAIATHVSDHLVLVLPVQLIVSAAFVWLVLGARRLGRPAANRSVAPPAGSVSAPTGSAETIWDPMTRREAVKLGLASSAVFIFPIRRLSAGESSFASPPVTPFQVALPIPPVLQAGGAFTHSCPLDPAWGSPVYYRVTMQRATVEVIPGLATEIFGYNGMYPGPTIRGEHGHPAVIRFNNQLDVPNVIHNHGGHQSGKPPGNAAGDSDSFPSDFIQPGGSKDYCYPHIAPLGDAIHSDFSSTQWYHDHAMDITGENVYHGLAGFYLLRDELEEDLIAAGKLPTDDFDIPLVIQDKLFAQNGALIFDTFDHNGFIGDRFVINGKVQPFMNVERKKYRFRLLNGSNARFYELELSSGSFLQIGNDSWLLPQAFSRKTINLAPAERADVIIDFRNAPSEVFLTNILEQTDGRGPKGRTRPGTPLVKFLVGTGAPVDNATIAPGGVLRPDTPILANEIVQTRRFEFARRHGAWVINDEFFDPNRDDATPKLGTAERWILKNGGGGWWHPIHIHLEAHHIQRINGKPPPLFDSFNKDTVQLAPNAEVEIFMKFRTFPTRYVFHCHNIEHEDMRMMATFNVVP